MSTKLVKTIILVMISLFSFQTPAKAQNTITNLRMNIALKATITYLKL